MSSPVDLPGRTSHTQELSDLQQRVQRESLFACGTSSVFKQFLVSGRTKFQKLPLRYLRHGFVALSIPAALIAGSVIPAARPVATRITPVAAAYAAQASLSAFYGDAAVADEATSATFAFTDIVPSLGAPVNTLYAPVAVEVANLRSGPGTGYDRVGKLKQGQTVRLLGKNGEWYKVQTNGGQAGWLHSELVEVDANVSNSLAVVKVTSAPSAAPVSIATTTDDKINLRGGPSTNYSVLMQLPAGLKLEVLSQQDGWVKVATPKGNVGWVTDDFVKFGGSTAPAKVNGPVKASVSAGRVNLRKGPNTGFGSYGKMASGTQLEVLARNGDWFKVRSPRGTVGWVARDLVNISAEDLKRVPVTNDVPALPKPVVQPAQPQVSGPAVAPSSGAASIALQFVGARYVYGGASPSGFDCSGLTLYVYRQLGLNLPHKASLQFNTPGQRIRSLGELAPGDLVFFERTTPAKGITHVGIYAGNGIMVTANTPQLGVQAVNVYGQYWSSRFVGGVRPAR